MIAKFFGFIFTVVVFGAFILILLGINFTVLAKTGAHSTHLKYGPNGTVYQKWGLDGPCHVEFNSRSGWKMEEYSCETFDSLPFKTN